MNLPSLLLAGAIAGGLCGLLGSGGGIPLLLLLRRYYPDAPKQCFALCVTVMTVLALTTLLRYGMAGILDISSAAPMLFPAVAGGVIGAKLLGKVSSTLLTVLFALICLVGGIRMLLW